MGTLDTYYEANMDLISVSPQLNLYNYKWPILTNQGNLPPAKTVFDDEGRRGQNLDSLVCGGCITSGATVRRSILGPSCQVHSYAVVEDSILFDNVEIGRNAKIRKAIIDEGIHHSRRHGDRLRPRGGPDAGLHRHRVGHRGGDEVRQETSMKTFKNLRMPLFLCALLLSAPASGCKDRQSSGPKKSPTPVTLCQGGVLTILPIIAHQQGFDAQEGLAITLKNMKDGKLAMDSLVAGECSFSSTGEPPIVNRSFRT